MKEEQAEFPILGLQSECNLKSKIANLKLWGLSVMAFVLVVGGPVAGAQQPGKVPRIGYLTGSSVSVNPPWREAFRHGLRELGYEEEKNIVIEWRFAEGKLPRQRALAAELVRLKVDVIVAVGQEDIRAAKEATAKIPIVMINPGDPVGSGFVASLARPGGNITGLAMLRPELSGKRLELLKESIPRLARVAIFARSASSDYAQIVKELDLAAGAFGVKLLHIDVQAPKDFDGAFQAAGKWRAEAVLFRVPGPILTPRRKEVVELAANSRLAVIYERAADVEAGGLMSYGIDINERYRRAATYVDKILKGAKPADLAVEQPTKFEFVINLKAAKQIGLTIPESVLYRADKIIK